MTGLLLRAAEAAIISSSIQTWTLLFRYFILLFLYILYYHWYKTELHTGSLIKGIWEVEKSMSKMIDQLTISLIANSKQELLDILTNIASMFNNYIPSFPRYLL